MTATETPQQYVEQHHHGPSPREYVQIAAVLFILTALEVSTYFVEFGRLGVPMLVVLMAIKFMLVVNFYMHLKFDHRVYHRLLYFGLSLAVAIYALTLVIIHFSSSFQP
jgi:cytochrome c oxidase subunit IV